MSISTAKNPEFMKTIQKIDFLKTQLNDLDGYLPETYQLLMNEMDQQQYNLMKHKIHEFYQEIDHEP